MEEQVTYIELESFRKGEVIFRAGDAGGCAYSVERGAVGVYTLYGTESQKMLKRLEPGSVFGEMGMVRGLPRSADVVAEENGTAVRRIDWKTLGQFFSHSPAKVVGIMQQMAQRIEELSNDYDEACGIIQELYEQRNRLLRDDMDLSKKIEQMRGYLLSKHDLYVEMPELPAWRRMENEGLLEEDKRLRKYVEDSMRYKKQNP